MECGLLQTDLKRQLIWKRDNPDEKAAFKENQPFNIVHTVIFELLKPVHPPPHTNSSN